MDTGLSSVDDDNSNKNSTLAKDAQQTGSLREITNACVDEERQMKLQNKRNLGDEDLEKELQKLKQRRSSVAFTKTRKSLSVFTDRQSFVSCTLGLEEQLSCIPTTLSFSEKVEEVLAIWLRECARKTGASCANYNAGKSFKVNLICESKNIAKLHATSVADKYYRVRDGKSVKCSEKSYRDKKLRSSTLDLIEKDTAKLKTEYKAWRSMYLERKEPLYEANRYFNNAKNGIVRIEEDQFLYLNDKQCSFLTAMPDYNQYLQNIDTAVKKTRLIYTEVARVSVNVRHIMSLAKMKSHVTSQYVEKHVLRQDGLSLEENIQKLVNSK